MGRKAQGLSINTIIIAAIALIVLVVLIAIFTGRIGLFSKGVSDVGTCQGLGGTCTDACTVANRVYGATDCGKDLSKEGGLNLQGTPLCCKA